MELFIKNNFNSVRKILCNIHCYKQWHPEILEGQLKMSVSSENSAIVYHKCKSYSNWYSCRDFIYLQHYFVKNKSHYIINKSIENSNFIPFSSIQRGNINWMVWKLTESEQGTKIFMDCKINHDGNLGRFKQNQLTVRYLKGFQQLAGYLSKNQQSTVAFEFDQNWVINNNGDEEQSSSLNLKTVNQNEFSQSQIKLSSNSQPFYSIVEDSELFQEIQDQQDPIEVQKLELQNSIIKQNKYQPQIMQLNSQGLVILPIKYLNKFHQYKPLYLKGKKISMNYQNIMCKNDWQIHPNGGLFIVNSEIIKIQNGVIKFLLSTFKKNLFSGKSIMNLSLPVDIFHTDSNLQRLCQCMSLAPQFLQNAIKCTNAIQRFKLCIAFAISNSILYFYTMKSFNPILGETFQATIDNCPIYAEQISHHPPITSVYMVGRGYKVHANIESKFNISLNSGAGINEGFYHIVFDDKSEVLFSTPPGQVSGLSLGGTRKYLVKGKMYVLDIKNQLFIQCKFQDQSGYFSSNKWKFTDQIEGKILKVNSNQLNKMISTKTFFTPSSKSIQKQLYQISGRWPLEILIDKITIYNINKDLPYEMLHNLYPLNSNSNYRQDLLYRKKNDYARSQIEKQRLEIIQRKDRKLRQQFNKKLQKH